MSISEYETFGATEPPKWRPGRTTRREPLRPVASLRQLAPVFPRINGFVELVTDHGTWLRGFDKIPYYAPGELGMPHDTAVSYCIGHAANGRPIAVDVQRRGDHANKSVSKTRPFHRYTSADPRRAIQ